MKFDKLHKVASTFAKIAGQNKGSSHPYKSGLKHNVNILESRGRMVGNPIMDSLRDKVANILNNAIKSEPYPSGNLMANEIFIFAVKNGKNWRAQGCYIEASGTLMQDKKVGKALNNIFRQHEPALDKALTNALIQAQKSGAFDNEEENAAVINYPVKVNAITAEI